MIRCVDKTCNDGPPLDDGEPGPRLAEDGALCQRHSDALERRVAELPARRDLLRDVLGGIQGARSGDGSKPTKGEPPLPLNVGAHDHLTAMHDQTREWVRLVAEERGEHGPATGDLRKLASYLVGRHSWVVRQSWVDDMAEEMRDLSKVADGLTRHRQRYHRKPTPCTRCGAQELGRWDGEEMILCNFCGVTYTAEQHQAVVTAAARASDALLSRAEAAELLDVDRAQLWLLIHRRKLKVAGTVEGEERFTAKAVQALRDEREGQA